MQKPFSIWVWLADMIVIVVFAAVGRQSHAEDNPLSAIVATATPFAVAWSLVGYLAGVLAPQPRMWWVLRSLVANVLACAVALVVRMVWLHRDGIPWTFALVAFAVTSTFLLGVRLFYRHSEART